MKTSDRKTFMGLLVCGALAPVISAAHTDEFESYGGGQFPASPWRDVASQGSGFRPPLPPAVVGQTTDATGELTQAVRINDVVAGPSGIYGAVPLSSFYSTTAEARIDRFSNQSIAPANDWPIEMAFVRSGGDFSAATSWASTPLLSPANEDCSPPIPGWWGWAAQSDSAGELRPFHHGGRQRRPSGS